MKYLRRWMPAFFLMPLAFGVQGQESVSEDFPAALLEREDQRYVSITLENDLFGSGRDQNYTNGVRIGWLNTGRKPPGITEDLERVLPYLDVNDTTSVTYSLGHNLYTPDDIESAEQDPDDRPWAAFAYGSMGMVTLDDNSLDEYEIALGVVGPMALGEPIQKTVHDVLGSPEPRGWDNQLKNEPGLILSWQRRWPKSLREDLAGTYLSLTPHFGLTAGNIYTYANAGATFKVSSEDGRWADKPLMVRPSIPGSGFFPRTRDAYWEVFFAVEGRAMARNIFLDGNTFTDSHSVDSRPLVGDVSAGVTGTWGRLRVGYTVVYRTREFAGQDEADVFGAVNIGIAM